MYRGCWVAESGEKNTRGVGGKVAGMKERQKGGTRLYVVVEGERKEEGEIAWKKREERKKEGERGKVSVKEISMT